MPVSPLDYPSFKAGSASYKAGAEAASTSPPGAAEIDSNLLKLHDGAAKLLGGLLQLRDGANQLSDGLNDEPRPGAAKLADGLNRRRRAGRAQLAAGPDQLAQAGAGRGRHRSSLDGLSTSPTAASPGAGTRAGEGMLTPGSRSPREGAPSSTTASRVARRSQARRRTSRLLGGVDRCASASAARLGPLPRWRGRQATTPAAPGAPAAAAAHRAWTTIDGLAGNAWLPMAIARPKGDAGRDAGRARTATA